MKNYFIKEYKKLYNYQKFEYHILMLKIIKKKFNLFLYFDKKWYYKSFCCECGRRRSVINFFLLSRLTLKKYLYLGRVSGLKRMSW